MSNFGCFASLYIASRPVQAHVSAGSRLFGATISTQPFRNHIFRCRSFSAQIVSAPIRCSLTVQLFRVRVWVRVCQNAPNIGAEKFRAEIVAQKSRWSRKHDVFAAKRRDAKYLLHLKIQTVKWNVFGGQLLPSSPWLRAWSRSANNLATNYALHLYRSCYKLGAQNVNTYLYLIYRWFYICHKLFCFIQTDGIIHTLLVNINYNVFSGCCWCFCEC